MEYRISREDSNRITLIRAVSIILVIYIHSNDDISQTFFTGLSYFDSIASVLKFSISRIIARIAVPAMYLISSVLLYSKPFLWKDNLLKKTRTLLLPYFIINTIWIILFAISQRVSVLEHFFSNPQYCVSKWNLYQFFDAYFGFSGEPLVYPLWFVRDLFFLNCISLLIKTIVDRIPRFFLVILLVSWCLNLNTHVFCCSIQSLTFWCLGYYIVRYGIHFEQLRRINPYVLISTYIVLLVLCCMTRTKTSFTYIYQICISVGVVTLFRCVCVTSNQKVAKITQEISDYSFGIYLFHELLLSTLKKACKVITNNSILGLIEYLIMPLFMVCVCIGICKLLEMVMPTFYAVLVGGRLKKKQSFLEQELHQ